MGHVVVVGSINVDIVATVPHLPEPGETVLAESLARHGGGKGANAAVAAARAGATVTMVGAVGTDADGEAQVDALAAEGIAVGAVVRADEPTGTALIAVDDAGANQIVVVPGANATLVPGAVAEAVLASGAGAGDALLLSLEVPLAAVVAAADAARQRGMTVVLNPAPVRDLPDELLAGTVCTPNRGELARLGGTADPAAAATRLLARGASGVAVTLGEAGAAVWDTSGHSAFAALHVVAVDTTGAGDCFSGVLAAGLAAGLPLRVAVARANAAAGLSVAVAGARGGMPRADEIDRALGSPRAAGS
jgi:ribokinase